MNHSPCSNNKLCGNARFVFPAKGDCRTVALKMLVVTDFIDKYVKIEECTTTESGNFFLNRWFQFFLTST
jgi:hypothetical protein